MTDCIHGVPISKGLMEGCRECDEYAQRIADKNKPKPRMKDIEILTQLERLAASFPWDVVNIWIERLPDGTTDYIAILQNNNKFGFTFLSEHGETPENAVDKMIKRCSLSSPRDPEKAREEKLATLKRQIAELQAVVIGTPPYVPNRELAEFVKPTIEVASV